MYAKVLLWGRPPKEPTAYENRFKKGEEDMLGEKGVRMDERDLFKDKRKTYICPSCNMFYELKMQDEKVCKKCGTPLIEAEPRIYK